MVNPDPIYIISIHYYDEAMGALDREIGNVENIALYKELSDKIGKPLLIGEIGPHHGFDEYRYTDVRNIDLSRRMIDKVVGCEVPITLFWAFRDDRSLFSGTLSGYDLRPGYTDQVLEMIVNGQRRLRPQTCDREGY